MKYRHSMPFGAEALGPGHSRIRLWAPSAHRVEVALAGNGERATLALDSTPDGWFEVPDAPAGAGAAYVFRIDGGVALPDPASRFNPFGVHGASMIVDPEDFDWPDDGWRGRPWEEAVIYELHLGTFTAEGTFAAAVERLDHLADLGVTAVELMPLAAFPGTRNWGYDGVLPFAPAAAYGSPEDLKRLVVEAHARELMVLLDVVYNHFGPEGNYLHQYAAPFFNPERHTPWGAAIDFDGPHSRTVRDFFIHNALFWLEEYRFDGLRVDAVHAIRDDSDPDIVSEIAAAVRAGPGAEREVHIVLENDDNAAHYLARRNGTSRKAGAPRLATAQWNDDLHHAAHVILTGESDGYYADYADAPIAHLGRCLAEGFAWQGEPSPYRHGERRGEPSDTLPPTAFVAFLQNHDQIGNRALGERLAALADEEALAALVAVQMLAPQVPLLFMGEEFGARTPFLYFCEFGPELAQAVTDGRRGEFARFERFASEEGRATIPDPNEPATFAASKLDWREAQAERGRHWLARYEALLAVRHEQLAPRLAGARAGRWQRHGDGGLAVAWPLGDGATLHLLANLGREPLQGVSLPPGNGLFACHGTASAKPRLPLPAWAVYWTLEPRGG